MYFPLQSADEPESYIAPLQCTRAASKTNNHALSDMRRQTTTGAKQKTQKQLPAAIIGRRLTDGRQKRGFPFLEPTDPQDVGVG